jgi:hypothetical protein
MIINIKKQKTMKNIKSVIVLAALLIGAVSCEEKGDGVWNPNDLNVSSITSYTAVLGWGGVADEFEVSAGDFHATITGRNVIVRDLTPDTDVRWSVRAIKDGTRSDWREHTFRTLPLPAQPAGLNAVPSFKTAELTWSGTEKKYEVEIGDTIYEVSETKCVAINLLPATAYTWNVRAKRGVDYSEWAQASFTTLARPAAPSNLAVTNVSYTSATFTWSGGEQAYELKVGSDIYQVDGTEYTLNDLTPGTQYTWGVRAAAGDDIYSDWAESPESSSFSTKDPLTAQISVANLNVMTADVTITPGAGVSAYSVLVASKEMYQEFVDVFTEGDEVAFMEMLGELYDTSAPSTETWELNGAPDYVYYAVVLLYDSDGEPYPEVIKHEFTSPAYQVGLPEASVSISVSEITATSARVTVTPDANAFGFYEGIFTKESYDETVAEDGEEYIKEYLAFYGYLSFTTDDDTWGLDPATEYIVVALPFNANGSEGYGALVTKTFTTLPGSAATSARSAKSVKSAKGMLYRERKALKKAVTAETVKTLNLQKKK